MKNLEVPSKKHLQKIISMLGEGEFTIPEFQRDFEWEPWDVTELLKSIFEDYYIGTPLFWKADSNNRKLLNCKPIYGYKGEGDPQYIVLDGQQRLTALYYAFFAPNENFPKRRSRYLYFVNLDELYEGNFDKAIFYDWKKTSVNKILSSEENQFRKRIFPLKLFGESSYEWIRWFKDYQQFWEKEGNEKEKNKGKKLEKFFEELISTYEISYILLERDLEIEKVCEIFTRINKSGVPLTIFDLLNALTRPKEIRLREMWETVSDTPQLQVTDSNKMKVYLLQTMSILLQGYCSPKYLYYLVPNTTKVIREEGQGTKEVTLITSSDDFIGKWNQSVLYTIRAVDRLKNTKDFGAVNEKFLPYPTMIPILAALLAEKDTNPGLDKKSWDNKVKSWYWSSIFTKSYSSSVESQMQKDWVELKKWFEDDNAVPSVVNQAWETIDNLNLFYETQQGSSIYKAIFDLLIINGARDWDTFDLPEYSNLEDHHIVPKYWGSKLNLAPINSILNRTPLSDITNNKVIGNKLPNKYLREMFRKYKKEEDVYDILNTHLITRKAVEILLRGNFDHNDFEEFLKERQSTIIAKIKSLIGMDKQKQSFMLQPKRPYSNTLQIRKLLLTAHEDIKWMDKYFSPKGLEIISECFVEGNFKVKNIYIITSVDKYSDLLRKDYKKLKEELKQKDINLQLRVLDSRKILEEIHDRWLIIDEVTYNIPSTDTIARGQYSEIIKSSSEPPFSFWWREAKDILLF